MWRSNVEVEGYSVAYFDRFVVVKMLEYLYNESTKCT